MAKTILFRFCLLSSFLIAGCQAKPVIGNQSLTCTDNGPNNCPSSVGPHPRCYQGLCIENSPPTVKPFDVLFVRLSGGVASIDATAQASDPEGDTLTYSWTQPAGQTATISGAGTATLAATATAVGTYAFIVTVNDPFGGTASATLSVNVITGTPPPLGSAIYVSDIGTDTPASGKCGSIEAPCATVDVGLQNRPAVTTPVIIAAPQHVPAYYTCLNVGDGENLWGGYSAGTFGFDATLIEKTRLECIAGAVQTANGVAPPCTGSSSCANGHLVSGSASINNLMLAFVPGSLPALVTTTPFTLFGLTLSASVAGSSQLQSVVVESPACGKNCTTIGLLSTSASPALNSVDVRGPAVVTFDPVQNFIGMLLVGGAPDLEGTPAATSGPVGKVLLSMPANGTVIGILSVRADLTANGVAVEGAFGPAIAGIDAFEGGATTGLVTINNSTVDITGFGSRYLTGVIVETLSNCAAGDWSCICGRWPLPPNGQGCPPSLPGFPSAGHPFSAAVTQNQVSLAGGEGGQGFVPCAGVGVLVLGPPMASTMAHNGIDIGPSFTLALGEIASGMDASHPISVSINHENVSIGDAQVDVGCLFQNFETNPNLPQAGAIGMFVRKADGATVSENTVTVGTNESQSSAMLVDDSAGKIPVHNLTLEHNTLFAGSAGSAVTAAIMQGVVLGTASMSGASDMSRFVRNNVQLFGGADLGTGLVLPTSFWQVDNNFIAGGPTATSIGLALTVDVNSEAYGAWPLVRHNTIFGGGDAVHTKKSVAVKTSVANASSTGLPATDPETGIFENNLIDAGGAGGRQVLFDNVASFVGTASPTVKNIAQFENPVPNPRPTLPFVTAKFNSLTAARTDSWNVWLAGSGEAVGLAKPGAAVVEASSTFLGSAVGAIWAGDVQLTAGFPVQGFVAVIPGGSGSVAYSEANNAVLGDFVTYTFTGGAFSPYAILAANPADNTLAHFPLFFIQRAAAPGGPGLWRVPFASSGYVAPAPETSKRDPLTLSDPTQLVSSPSSSRFWVVDQRKLHAVKGFLPLDLSSQVSANIDLMAEGNLDSAPPPGASGDVPDDLVVFVGNKGYFWLNVWTGTPGAGSWTLGTTYNFTATPCGTSVCEGGKPTVVGVATMGLLGGAQSVVVGCDNGYLDVFLYSNISMPALTCGVRETTGSSITSLAVSAANNQILVVHRANNLAVLYDLKTGTAHNATQLNTTPTSLTFVPDVVMRDIVHANATYGQYQDVTKAVAAGFSFSAPPAVCPLVNTSAPPYDLHLAPGTNACVGTGAVIVTPLPLVSGDIDSITPRPSPPDIGADQTGQ